MSRVTCSQRWFLTCLIYSSCWATSEGWGGNRSRSSSICRCSCSWAAAWKTEIKHFLNRTKNIYYELVITFKITFHTSSWRRLRNKLNSGYVYLVSELIGVGSPEQIGMVEAEWTVTSRDQARPRVTRVARCWNKWWQM